jgi:hypothetical protein
VRVLGGEGEARGGCEGERGGEESCEKRICGVCGGGG